MGRWRWLTWMAPSSSLRRCGEECLRLWHVQSYRAEEEDRVVRKYFYT
jgi:hypothetical protein